MTKDEALKLAIKALEACKEALEQPAQDYVLICKRCGDDLGIEYVPDEQPAQECKLCTARDINFDDDIIVDNYEIKLYNDLDEYPDNSKDA